MEENPLALLSVEKQFTYQSIAAEIEKETNHDLIKGYAKDLLLQLLSTQQVFVDAVSSNPGDFNFEKIQQKEDKQNGVTDPS